MNLLINEINEPILPPKLTRQNAELYTEYINENIEEKIKELVSLYDNNIELINKYKKRLEINRNYNKKRKKKTEIIMELHI